MNTLRLPLALAALTLVAALPAQARDVTRSANGPRGSAQSHLHRTQGSSTRTTTWTDDSGRSGSHTATRTVDASAQTLNKQSSTTLRDGRTASRAVTTTRTDAGVDRAVTATGPNGTTVTRETSIAKPEPANPTP